MLVIFTDGASLGNPGPMGIGVVVYQDGVRIEELSEYVGDGTNNIAEYTAVIRALQTVHELGQMDAHIKCDSELVVRQLNGDYWVRDPELRELKGKIDSLCRGLNVRFEHIPREHNAEADSLSKEGAEIGRKREGGAKYKRETGRN